MTLKEKIAFAIGAALTKRLKVQVAVCRVGEVVEWRVPEGGYAVADLSTVSPKAVLDAAHTYLAYKIKMHNKGK